MIKHTKKSLSLLTVLLMTVSPLSANPDLSVDEMAVLTNPELSSEELNTLKKKWVCEYCPNAAEEPWYLQVDAGLGFVSNDSYQFGQYNGLNEEGAFLVLNFDSQYRNGSGNYFTARGDNLGLDNRSLELEGGKQGTYQINFLYDQISKFDEDTARTPYDGDSVQTLPSGWVDAPGTSGFTALNNSLQEVELYSQRQNFKIGGKYIQDSRLSYDINFDRQTKEGKQSFGAAIGSNFALARAAILAAPVEYTTDQVGLGVNYKGNDFSTRLAIVNSSFRNANESLRWENAFDQPPGVTEGQSATDPDNDMQQVMLTLSYHGIDDLNLAGYFSHARMTQDQDFLPYTITPPPTVVTTALPVTSLGGEVLATTGSLKANWQFLPRTRLNVLYDYQEQDNNTETNPYEYVIADTQVVGTARINPAYSFRTQRFNLDLGHRFENKIKLEGGVKYKTTERTFQEVDKQKDTGLWAAIGNSISDSVHARLKIESSDRQVDDYQQLVEVVPPENTLTRKYNMADRKGNKAIVNLTYSGIESFVLSFQGDFAKYDYSDSEIGLTELSERNVGLDAQYMASEALSLTAYVNRACYNSEQAGSSAVSTPDWFAINNTVILTAGLGGSYQVIEEELLVGMDYVHAQSTGIYEVEDQTEFPDLTTTRDSIKIYADYNLSEQMIINVTYLFEQYKEENWQVDDVDPNTNDFVLSMGEISPDYNIGVIWASLKYRF